MTIHNSIQSGGESAYIVLLQDDVKCETKDFGPFNKGATLGMIHILRMHGRGRRGFGVSKMLFCLNRGKGGESFILL